MGRDPGNTQETILITSYLEPALVDRITAVDQRVAVLYDPSLIYAPRYPADHGAEHAATPRSAGDEERWRGMLRQATILFDFDRTHEQDLPELAPNVRWVQSTSAGIGEKVRGLRYTERMPNAVFTTASGVHAIPLAEFAAMAMLMHSRRALHMVSEQASRRWRRFSATDLERRTVVVVGLGAVGSEVARVAKALRMRVLGVRRGPSKPSDGLHIDAVYGADTLSGLLPEADFLILIAPHTAETEGMIGAAELALLPRGAVLINIARGALVDEAALIASLEAGHLGGFYADVFAQEPLAATSPLWSMPNVLIDAHSASVSDRENERIVDLFCDNLKRYLEGKPLRNQLDPNRGY